MHVASTAITNGGAPFSGGEWMHLSLVEEHPMAVFAHSVTISHIGGTLENLVRAPLYHTPLNAPLDISIEHQERAKPVEDL